MLTRQYDWSPTPLGDPVQWPQPLRTVVGMILSSKFPMFLWWGEDLIQFYNDAYRPSMGNNGKHPLALGQKGVDCWPEIWGIIYPLIRQVLTTGEATWSEDQLIPIYRNGKIEDVYWTFGYSPVRGEDGNIEGVLVVCNETTEKVRTLQRIEEMVAERTRELDESNKKLQKSNADLAQFAYIASHDLQEPVRKVGTFIQMLENSLGNINDVSRGYITRINNSTERMLTLIRDILAYSELSRETEVFRPVDLQQVVEGVLVDFELLIVQKNAVIRYSGLPVIDAIPLQMSQLFRNLISNALKFSRQDRSPVISIEVGPLPSRDLAAHKLPYFQMLRAGYIDIVVSDNGIGFKQEYEDKIFSIFQRLHGKSEYPGTGIGLAICRKIAQNHQGEIYAVGEPDRGAAFHVLLPERQE